MNSDLNPKNFILFCNLKGDCYSYSELDNSFIIFKSINSILYLISASVNNSIISFNLINTKKINEIKKWYQKAITNFRHHLDKINKRDLILSISASDYIVKVWNAYNFECILNLNNIHIFHSKNYGYKLYSACFLTDNKQDYIITSDCSDYIYSSESDPIKIFDLNGNKIKEIKESIINNTFFIDTYYDEKYSRNYIITGNCGFIESYDYNNNKIYHKYTHHNDLNNKNNIYSYESLIISTLGDNNNNNEKIILKLIASCSDGFIKIWNFHSGELLKIIKVFGTFLHGICLINNNYLAVGCGDKTIKIVDIKKKKVIKVLYDNNYVCCIKNFIHPLYGICLISQGMKINKYNNYIYNNGISLWVNKYKICNIEI